MSDDSKFRDVRRFPHVTDFHCPITQRTRMGGIASCGGGFGLILIEDVVSRNE